MWPFRKKTKEIQEVKVIAIKEPETMTIEKFEELTGILLQFESCVSSPMDGSPIGMIRTEDVINTIAEFEKIDLSKTNYSHFTK